MPVASVRRERHAARETFGPDPVERRDHHVADRVVLAYRSTHQARRLAGVVFNRLRVDAPLRAKLARSLAGSIQPLRQKVGDMLHTIRDNALRRLGRALFLCHGRTDSRGLSGARPYL
jgi:hypothetical protein